MKRPLLVVAATLAALALQPGTGHAAALPVSHGSVLLTETDYQQSYVEVALTGTLAVGTRTWVGTVTGSRDLYGRLLQLHGTSSSGVFHAYYCTDETAAPSAPGGGAIVCQASINDGPVTRIALGLALTSTQSYSPPYHGQGSQYLGTFAGS